MPQSEKRAAGSLSSECWELDGNPDREARSESPGRQHNNVNVLRLGDVHRVVVVRGIVVELLVSFRVGRPDPKKMSASRRFTPVSTRLPTAIRRPAFRSFPPSR